MAQPHSFWLRHAALVASCGFFASTLGAFAENVAAQTGARASGPGPAMANRSEAGSVPNVVWVGSASCKSCHAKQYTAWSSSLHAAAMRDARTDTKASFGGHKATFGKDASSSAEFLGKSAARSVRVREGKSDPASYDVRYVFGRRPLEQYLVAAENGRLQALPVGYDTAKLEWFDIFSGEERLPGEFGHWLGRGMNANSQCITCHTTNYRAGYDENSSAYSASWSEMGVGCEACHGAGAAHVADPKQPYGPFGKSAGIAAFRPKPTPSAEATLAGAPATDSVAPASSEAPPPAADLMMDTCAACHSVRRPIADGFAPGANLLDHYEPSLLDDDIYWPDGHVRTEGYEWGSFVQSRMYEKGVNCLACHDVHSGELRADGNDLCMSCHEPRLAEISHAAHDKGTAGAQCVSCHMPESVFMARDRRRDHSLSVPDPISAQQTATPSACESCHADRGRDVLAADAQRLWPALKEERYEKRRAVTRAFAAARDGKAESAPVLRECLTGLTCTSAILRASAAKLASRLPLDAPMAGALLEALEDSDALVRSAAAFALADVDPREPMLRQSLSAAAADKIRAVRINAAWALRTIETERLPKEQAEPLERAFEEWRESARVLSDAPETWHSLGVFETSRGRPDVAETDYRKAIAMSPRAVPSRHNLAMLLVGLGRTGDAKKEFEALVADDDSLAAAWYALGMIHGEEKNWGEAAKALGRCLNADRDYPGALTDLTHAYLEAGVPNVAIAVLNGALKYPGARREALAGLVAVALKSGDQVAAAESARNLVAEDPSSSADPDIAKLISGVGVAQPSPARVAEPSSGVSSSTP